MSVSSHEQLPLSADGAEDLHVLHVHVSEQELRAGTDIEADLPLDARLRIIR